jgi:Ribosomal protein L7/L12 C-terminal domain
MPWKNDVAFHWSQFHWSAHHFYMESFSSGSTDDRSFRLDSRTKSFRLYPPVRWKDVPLGLLLLVLVVVLLTGINFAASKLLGFLNRETLLVIIGVCVGFQLAIWILRYRSQRASAQRVESRNAGLGPVSDRVRVLASDPNRKIEAIKALQEETGLGLAEAKAAVEAIMILQRPK